VLTSEPRAGLTVFPRGNYASVTSPKSTFDISNLLHAVEPIARVSLPAEGLTPLHLSTMQVLTLLNMPRGRKLKFKTSQDLGEILGFSSKEVLPLEIARRPILNVTYKHFALPLEPF